MHALQHKKSLPKKAASQMSKKPMDDGLGGKKGAEFMPNLKGFMGKFKGDESDEDIGFGVKSNNPDIKRKVTRGSNKSVELVRAILRGKFDVYKGESRVSCNSKASNKSVRSMNSIKSCKSEKEEKKPVPLKKITDIKKLYKFGQKLGEGSFGKVHKAVSRKHGFKCAIKQIKKKYIDAKSFRKRAMMSELEVLDDIKNHNVIRTYEMLHDDEYYYIVTELAKEGDLFQFYSER